jgi:hypothetical protein
MLAGYRPGEVVLRTKSKALAAAALAVLAPLGALAAPAQAGANTGKAEQYCVVVLGKAPSPGEVSPELYRHCSPTPFDTRAHLRSAQAHESYDRRSTALGSAVSSPDTLTAAADVLLMRAWSNANYSGPNWEYWAGAPCDQYGYRWDPNYSWSLSVSSIEKGPASNCHRARLHTRDMSKWQEFGLSLPYVGSTYNDNVGRVQIWNG